MLKIDGDLTWGVSRAPASLAERGLGYLLSSAVTVNGDHVIVGETTFGAPVSAVDIKSDRDIDDVALEAIVKDSLMKNSLVDQVRTLAPACDFRPLLLNSRFEKLHFLPVIYG